MVPLHQRLHHGGGLAQGGRPGPLRRRRRHAGPGRGRARRVHAGPGRQGRVAQPARARLHARATG
ncbi:MAG: hypothetical protein MZV64_68030 [Ignavibacteriales bacterium]|nr:hypothetical protein [Ignavibacteriales bacterium]